MEIGLEFLKLNFGKILLANKMFQDPILLIFTSIFSIIFISLLYYHRKLFLYPKELTTIPTVPIIRRFRSIINKTPHDEVYTESKEYVSKGIYKVKFFKRIISYFRNTFLYLD